MMSNFESCSTARARQSSCLCPTLNAEPPSPTSLLSPLCKAWIASTICARRSAFHIFASLASPKGSRLFRTVPALARGSAQVRVVTDPNSRHALMCNETYNKVGSCGSIAILCRCDVTKVQMNRVQQLSHKNMEVAKSVRVRNRTSRRRPRVAMFTPSISIRPLSSSRIRNRSSIIDDFPAPVLPVTAFILSALGICSEPLVQMVAARRCRVPQY